MKILRLQDKEKRKVLTEKDRSKSEYVLGMKSSMKSEGLRTESPSKYYKSSYNSEEKADTSAKIVNKSYKREIKNTLDNYIKQEKTVLMQKLMKDSW